MKRKMVGLALAALGALVLVAATSGAGSANLRVHADLKSISARAPRASGRFSGVVARKRGKWHLTWSLTFRRLSSLALRADIKRGAKVVVPLCTYPCGTRVGAGGVHPVTVRIIRLLRSGQTQVVVVTRKSPKGELRGQLLLGR